MIACNVLWCDIHLDIALVLTWKSPEGKEVKLMDNGPYQCENKGVAVMKEPLVQTSKPHLEVRNFLEGAYSEPIIL